MQVTAIFDDLSTLNEIYNQNQKEALMSFIRVYLHIRYILRGSMNLIHQKVR